MLQLSFTSERFLSQPRLLPVFDLFSPLGCKHTITVVLVFLGFGVDVADDNDVGEVDPEPAEQSGHPESRRQR